MYAVSKIGIGLIAGTLCYSRKAAIEHFLGRDQRPWEQYKRTGYRTVFVRVDYEWIQH